MVNRPEDALLMTQLLIGSSIFAKQQTGDFLYDLFLINY